MHVWTHLRPEAEGVTGHGIYPDGMVEHDKHVGQLLAKLEELGIADSTIVMYSTDNGAEKFTWPDGGTSPFRGEKNENWEGGFRVPLMVRWPGKIKPGTRVNEIISHTDWFPTLAGATGTPDVKAKLKKGTRFDGQRFKVHLDGYNLMPFLNGETDEWPRKEFFYFSDDGNLLSLRYNAWKIVFAEQRAHGFAVWADPFTNLRFPKLINLRSDPFEEADEIDALGVQKFRADRMYALVPAQAIVGRMMATFKEFPPRQTPDSFTIDQAMEKLTPPSR